MALLEKELDWLRRSEWQRQVVQEACQAEYKNLRKHSSDLVSNPVRQSLESLVHALKEGNICRERSALAVEIVKELTTPPSERDGRRALTSAEAATEKKRHMPRILLSTCTAPSTPIMSQN